VRRADLESTGIAGNAGHRCLAANVGTGAARPLEQPLVIESGMKSGMIGDDGTAAIALAVDLGALLALADHREVLAEMRLAQAELAGDRVMLAGRHRHHEASLVLEPAVDALGLDRL
jgi:hypothetical protein